MSKENYVATTPGQRSRTTQAKRTGREVFASAAVLGKDGLHHGTDTPAINPDKFSPVTVKDGMRSRTVQGVNIARDGAPKRPHVAEPAGMMRNRNGET